MKKNLKSFIGYGSVCEDGKHVIFWDFDISDRFYNRIYTSLKNIQKLYDLSNIYVIQSENGFNALCLDKCNKNEAYKIKKETYYSDRKHNFIGSKYNNWVLRIGDDKKLYEIIRKKSKWEKSYAHKILIEALFDIKIKDLSNFDNYTNVLFDEWVKVKNNEKE
jgi:hypothetical protein